MTIPSWNYFILYGFQMMQKCIKNFFTLVGGGLTDTIPKILIKQNFFTSVWHFRGKIQFSKDFLKKRSKCPTKFKKYFPSYGGRGGQPNDGNFYHVFTFLFLNSSLMSIGFWWCSFWTHFLCLEMSYFFASLSFSSLELLEYSFGQACWGRDVMSGEK